jgi:hypothetical protein
MEFPHPLIFTDNSTKNGIGLELVTVHQQTSTTEIIHIIYEIAEKP